MLLIAGLAVLAAVSGRICQAQESPRASSAAATYDPKNKRDPFVPCARDGRFVGCGVEIQESAKPFDNPDFKLEAIVWDPSGSSYAMINGNVVGQGQQLGEFVVKTIMRDSVTLKRGEESVVLRISFEKPEPSEEQQQPPRGGKQP
ncbi:MAG: hypothetical protein HYZ92_01750 [Candidatus Omnitrophica bacterium]|nr:hypothetical protein [Candidatus Omnitrophota bacterium]